MGLLSRVGSALGLVRQTEGQYRPGPYYLPVTGGWLSAEAGRYWNWWQLGYDVQEPGSTAIVEACVSAYAQTVAMCPGDHWLATRSRGGELDGGRERVENSSLTRFLRRPNSYQSISDFLLNATRRLYLSGNAYGLALRNARFEISEIHLMDSGTALVAPDTGEVFYRLDGNEIIENRFDTPLIVPSRDVLHIRLHTNGNPLEGMSPLQSAAMDAALSGAMTAQQYAFYMQQGRPAHVLTTDMMLTAEQVAEVRARWDAQSKGLNAGGTPILTAGLKPHSLSSTADDAQLAEVLKLTDQHIALVYRIPLQILGIGGTPFASTEALMQSWRASGLGFALNHIEEAFGQLFQLRGQPDEYLEFGTSALMRSAHKDRIDALARGVQGGIYSPNEARAEEGLPMVEHGDEPRVQQQVVPLSFGAKQQPEPPPVAPPPPRPAADDEDPPDDDAARHLARDLIAAADEIARRAA